jgi:hypothetical protein
MTTKHADTNATNLQPYQPPSTLKKPFRQEHSTNMPKFSSRLDLTHLEAPPGPHTKVAETHYALGGRYPITALPQVKEAMRYFEEECSRFSPEDRREFAYNLTKRAEEMGCAHELGKKAALYGGEYTEDLEEVKFAFFRRQEMLRNEEHQALLDKVAEKLPYMTTGQRIEALCALDKMAGLEGKYNGHFPDPYASLLKTAREKKAACQFSEHVGTEMILESELEELAHRGKSALDSHFSDDWVLRFRSNPTETFKGLPKEQKALVTRLAKNVGSSGKELPDPGYVRLGCAGDLFRAKLSGCSPCLTRSSKMWRRSWQLSLPRTNISRKGITRPSRRWFSTLRGRTSTRSSNRPLPGPLLVTTSSATQRPIRLSSTC